MTRPSTLVAVAGTGTEVGKTWVAAAVCARLRAAGTGVAARKPAQSFEPDDPPSGTDAALLGDATGEPAERVCPPHRWYPVAMAPPMAADALGLPPLRVHELLDEIGSSWPDPAVDVGLVELAGGPWSPITHDADGIDLTAAIGPDVVVLVADAGLGTLNAVRPAFTTLAAIAPVIVVLNRFDEHDDLHRRNRSWLVDREGIDVVVGIERLCRTLSGWPAPPSR